MNILFFFSGAKHNSRFLNQYECVSSRYFSSYGHASSHAQSLLRGMNGGTSFGAFPCFTCSTSMSALLIVCMTHAAPDLLILSTLACTPEEKWRRAECSTILQSAHWQFSRHLVLIDFPFHLTIACREVFWHVYEWTFTLHTTRATKIHHKTQLSPNCSTQTYCDTSIHTYFWTFVNAYHKMMASIWMNWLVHPRRHLEPTEIWRCKEKQPWYKYKCWNSHSTNIQIISGGGKNRDPCANERQVDYRYNLINEYRDLKNSTWITLNVYSPLDKSYLCLPQRSCYIRWVDPKVCVYQSMFWLCKHIMPSLHNRQFNFQKYPGFYVWRAVKLDS